MGIIDKLTKKKDNKLTYKERNGTTRVGDFLRGVKNVAPDVLALAGNITGIGQLEVLGNAIRGDKNMTPLNKELALKELELDMLEMQELTKRLESDNEHNITRLIRPASYAFVWVLFAVNMFFDGNVGNYQLNSAYIPVINNLLGIMTMFYFGSRGVEKIVGTLKS